MLAQNDILHKWRERYQNELLVSGSLLHLHNFSTAPYQYYDGLQQQNMSSGIASFNTLLQISNRVPDHRQQKMQYPLYSMETNDSHVIQTSQQKANQSIDPPIPIVGTQPSPLPPKIGDGTCEVPRITIQLTPTNKRQTQVITPDCSDTHTVIQKEKPQRKKRKRKLQFNEDETEKMHDFSTQYKSCKFTIANFGFPSSLEINTKEASCMSTLAFRTSSKRENPHLLKSRVLTAIKLPRFSIIPPSRKFVFHLSTPTLHEDWKKQLTQRRKGIWTPNGHLTGRWKPPEWAGGCISRRKKHPRCQAKILKKLHQLVASFMAKHKPDVTRVVRWRVLFKM